MERSEFIELCHRKDKPTGLNRLQLALWFDAHGKVDDALALLRRERSESAARLRAYLHRKGGDSANANYWYKRSGIRRRWVTIEEERSELISSVCNT